MFPFVPKIDARAKKLSLRIIRRVLRWLFLFMLRIGSCFSVGYNVFVSILNQGFKVM